MDYISENRKAGSIRYKKIKYIILKHMDYFSPLYLRSCQYFPFSFSIVTKKSLIVKARVSHVTMAFL